MIWIQAETITPPGQTTILRTLAIAATGLPTETIVPQAGLRGEEVRAALETLTKHAGVKQDGENWRFTVKLMRRWAGKT